MNGAGIVEAWSADHLAGARALHSEHGSDVSRRKCNVCRWLATLDAALAAARTGERARCVKIARHFIGGYTASLETDVLVPDKDGPWALNSEIAAAILTDAPPDGAGQEP